MHTDQFLKSLSNQNILFLNPLGTRSYTVAAGFDEQLHKKFYHMRQLLLKVCQFNKKHHYKPVDLGTSPEHIYKELILNNKGHQFKLKDEN